MVPPIFENQRFILCISRDIIFKTVTQINVASRDTLPEKTDVCESDTREILTPN